MARRIIKTTNDLDFTNINNSLPKDSPLLKNPKEETAASEDAHIEDNRLENNDSAKYTEQQDQAGQVEVQNEQTIEGTETKAEALENEEDKKAKEETPVKTKKEKKPRKKDADTTLVESKNEVKNSASDIKTDEEVSDFNEIPDFYDILYNEYDNDRTQITLTLDKINLRKLDIVNEMLPKGQKSSRGQILSNLLTFFFSRCEAEVNAMTILYEKMNKKKK